MVQELWREEFHAKNLPNFISDPSSVNVRLPLANKTFHIRHFRYGSPTTVKKSSCSQGVHQLSHLFNVHLWSIKSVYTWHLKSISSSSVDLPSRHSQSLAITGALGGRGHVRSQGELWTRLWDSLARNWGSYKFCCWSWPERKLKIVDKRHWQLNLHDIILYTAMLLRFRYVDLTWFRPGKVHL